MIKAPFNFVPLADKLYFPNWADKVSLDIPFADGVCGSIDLTITAKSPIFIRNGHSKDEAEMGRRAVETALESNPTNPDFTEARKLAYNSFSKNAAGYFIPATSIKGEVRSILEILSYGKIRVDVNTKFAQREWENRELYTLKGQQANLLCGYLRRSHSKNGYEIVDCGKPYRIGHDKIDEYLNSKGFGENIFRNNFSMTHGIDLNKEITIEEKKYDPKTAVYKYHLIGSCKLTDLRFTLDNTSTEYSDRLYVSSQGNIHGDIVLTGQPDKWKWPRPTRLDPRAGKFYEFVFGPESGTKYSIDEIDVNHFKFIYGDSKEWNRIKELLETPKGVPVFYRKEKGRLKDFGLAFLYKLPYEKSPYDIIQKRYGDDLQKQDLAECMFGRIGNISDSLKGRVQFTDAISNNAQEDGYAILVLNSPKASYYPIYIKQQGSQGVVSKYNTYNNGELSGWKRYTVRRGDITWQKSTGSSKLDTVIFPLKQGAIFEGKVYFQNLRPIELGALLSALTYHSTEKCFHQLGQGKPYGFGKVIYKISLHCNSVANPEYYMALFEEEMNKKFGNWLQSDSISSLITMAQVEVSELDYQYMALDMNGNNDFVAAKKEREYLQDFRTLQRVVIKPNSLLSHIATYKLEQQKKKAEEMQHLKLLELERLNNWCDDVLSNISKMDQGDLDTLDNAINELGIPSALVSLEEKYDMLTKLDDTRKKVEEAIRSQNAKKAVAGGLAVDIAKVSSFGNLQGRVKTWIKKVKEVEGRESLTNSEIEAIRDALKRLPSKELKKGIKRDSSIWREFAALLGEETVNGIYSELFS